MIPKIFHHIWFGSKPYPYPEYGDAWIRLHPEYEFHLWNESNIPRCDLKTNTLTILDNPQIPPVSKADSLRFDIIEAIGGVYLDSDMEPLRSIAAMFDNNEFIGESVVGGIVGAGIFGSIPHGDWVAGLSNTMNNNILNNLDIVSDMKMNVLEYMKICGTSSLQNRLKTCKKIYPVETFYPDQLPNPDFDKAYTRHHWGSGKNDGWISQRFAA